MSNDTNTTITTFAPTGTTIFLVATAKGKLAKAKSRTIHRVARHALYLIDENGKMTFRPIDNAKVNGEGHLEININTDRYARFTK